MALNSFGSLPSTGALQPGSALTEHSDGTIQGHCIYETDATDLPFLPRIEDPHPRDNRVEITSRHLEWLPQDRLRLTCECFGLVDDPTDKVITYLGTPDRERIETHPDFVSVLAGTPAATLNGAEFHPQTSDFEGFRDTANDLFGVQFWLRATTQVTLTWWSSQVPDLENRMQVVDSVPPFKPPADVVDFLILDLPYRQIGNFFQRSQLVLGSAAPGWNKLVYPDK